MKKITYSIVVALILSIILALISPTWFLEEDAQRTYQNGAACIDIKFGGNLKNGHVDAKGTGLRVTQPSWLSHRNYQGTMVEIPVSYRTKTYWIKLTPRADEWGKDSTLIMELKSADFRRDGKSGPAWISFRNIILNGKPAAAEKAVWHNKPFVLRSPLHSSQEITLAFDVRKPLAVSDIAFVNLLVVFLAFFLSCLFLTSLRRAADHVLTFIDRKDIVNILRDKYLHIHPVYRRSYWVIFSVLCFAFGFHTICFMWGNHDWSLLESSQQWLSHTWDGRYMLFSLKIPLLKGVYLPLIYDLITFIVLALNAVLLCTYWRLEKRVTYYVLCGLILTAQPYTLSMMYFVHMTPEVFIGVACTLVALRLSEKVTLVGVSPTSKIVYSLIAIIGINFALAIYPVLINTIAVALVGKLLVYAFGWDGSRQQLKSYIRSSVISVTLVILGIASYKFVITFIFPIRSSYNTDTLPLARVPERLGALLRQSIHQLYEYNMPFLPGWITWIFLGFVILLTLHICSTGNLKQKAVRLFLLFSSLFATQTAMIIARVHLIDGRVELFGLVFFEVLVMSLLITRIRKLKNLWIITGACVIFSSIINDLDCLRVWKLGFDAEKMLWNRILARVEMQKDFNPARKYEIVHVGLPISMRPRYYTGTGDKSFMLYQAYDFSHDVLCAPLFYYPTHFRGESFSTGRNRSRDSRRKQGYETRLKRLYQAGVLQKAEVWPKPHGLIVWKNIILFVTDGRELNKYKRQFERELGKR